MKIKLLASTAPEENFNYIKFFASVDDYIYLFSKNLDNNNISCSFLKPAKSLDEAMDAWCLDEKDFHDLSVENLSVLNDMDKQNVLSLALKSREEIAQGIEFYDMIVNSSSAIE